MREDAERDQHHLRNRSEDVVKDPVRLVADLKDDGLIGFERIERSNGGLFDGVRALSNEGDQRLRRRRRRFFQPAHWGCSSPFASWIGQP
jgi:hypothetical protein